MKVFGIIVLALAILVAAIPQFSNCNSEGKSIALPNGKTIPMKCLWTARAELALALPLITVGVMLAASMRRETHKNLALLGTLLGILVILMPVSLIGVCQTTMLCNTVMKPSMVVLGSAVMATNLVGLVVLQRARKKVPAKDYERSQVSP